MRLQQIWIIHSARNMDTVKTVRVGVVGVGTIGSAHAQSIYEDKIVGMKLSALCDTDAEKCTALSEKYRDVTVYRSYNDMISSGKIDAVIIATPHYLHPEIAISAFEHGLHVLTEKPAGVYTSAVKNMITAAKNSGRIFAVMFNQRTNKLFSKAHELMQSGTLGELKRVIWIITNWYRKQSYYDSGNWRGTWSGEGGGVLINQAPHNLDLWQWICGMPCSLSAECNVGKYHDIDVEDEAIIKAHYANGATALFITSTGDYPGTNRLEISGTRGKMVLENGKLVLSLLERDERQYCLEKQKATNSITVTEFEDEVYKGHPIILQNFANAILYGETLIASGYESIHELELSNAAYLSAWTGEEVAIPVDCDKFEHLLQERITTDNQKSVSSDNTASYGKYIDRWNTNW